MPDYKRPPLQLAFDWRVTALVLLLLPLLLSLGFWQLDRAEEKRQLQSLFKQRQLSGPVEIERLFNEEDLRYQPVRLTGEFINEKALLLDNRIYHGRFGYEIITPFQLASSDRIVLVNRGWLAADSARRSLPAIAPVEGVVELIGEVYVPTGEMLRLADIQATSWPKVEQSVNVALIAKEFNKPLFAYTVRLAKHARGVFQPNWVIVNLQPEKHTGYAVQWFAMSFTLLLIAVLANTNVWTWFKRRIK